MEAPEKIYLIRNISTTTSLNSTNDCHEKYLQEWYKGREKDTDIEYTRTDAVIEKACDAYCKVCGHFAHSVPTHICRHDCRYFSDFKKYMKGE